MKFWIAIAIVVLPGMAQAADVSGIPKIREGDQIQIGSARIRLAGIDAPSVDQLCLNTKGERWTCGVAARDELIKHADNKPYLSCAANRPPRPRGGAVRSRRRRHPEMDGEERMGAILCAIFP